MKTSGIQNSDQISSGYYNPILSYSEDKAIQDASEAGANGFIMVDLPPEEALTFREKCRAAKCVHTFFRLSPTSDANIPLYSLSYVPLIAPSTTLARIEFLSSIADSFIYVVSKVSLKYHFRNHNSVLHCI